jgi:hypothetical protein
MRPLIRRFAPAVVAAALLSCDQDDETVSQSLLGVWNVVGYEEAGVAGTVSGTVSFNANGTVSFAYSLTLPGEPTLVVLASGTWDQSGRNVSLLLDGTAFSYSVEFSGDMAELRQFGGSGIVYLLQRA